MGKVSGEMGEILYLCLVRIRGFIAPGAWKLKQPCLHGCVCLHGSCSAFSPFRSWLSIPDGGRARV